MASKILNTKESLLQLMECPICLDQLGDPRLLCCGHILCYMCVNSYSEKGGYSDKLPCPVCRKETGLYEGGVDNLPKFFFIHDLKEVAMREDNIAGDDIKQRSGKDYMCSAHDCGQPAVNYCETGCQFLCQQCSNDHCEYRITKSHIVIQANDYKEVSTYVNETTYPPCNRHKHQLVDLYCRTCNIPICTTCSQANHRGHDVCELDKQAEVCKTNLEQIQEETDALIEQVKRAITKTESQAMKAQNDIDDISDTVKSSFKKMHDKLDAEEDKILSDLLEARKRVTKTTDITVDSQRVTLANMEGLKCIQIKLTNKGNVYDYVTVTDSIQRDLTKYYGQHLPGFLWSSNVVRKDSPGRVYGKLGRVEVKQCEKTKIGQTKCKEVNHGKELKKVNMIRQENQDFVLGIAIHNNHIYTVHYKPLTLYCYTQNGVLKSKYEQKGGEDSTIQGMCLMIDGDSAKIVVSDWSHNTLVWISIYDDKSMGHHLTQKLDYQPRGSCNDKGTLLVCDDGHKIHRYTSTGEIMNVIKLPSDVTPWFVANHAHNDQYIVTDPVNNQIVAVDKEGHVMFRMTLGDPREVITDPHGRILIADCVNHQVLIIDRDVDEVRHLIQQDEIRQPISMCLDTHSHRLYVSGKDRQDIHKVFVFEYNLPIENNTLIEVITKIDLTVHL